MVFRFLIHCLVARRVVVLSIGKNQCIHGVNVQDLLADGRAYAGQSTDLGWNWSYPSGEASAICPSANWLTPYHVICISLLLMNCWICNRPMVPLKLSWGATDVIASFKVIMSLSNNNGHNVQVYPNIKHCFFEF